MAKRRRAVTRAANAQAARTSPIDSVSVGKAAWAGTAVTALTFTLYLATAARNIVVGDTPELMAAAATFGVAHPPGYPLLTLLGYVFSFLPVEPIAFRLNLLAVACGTGTVALIYFTALRLTRHQVAAAVAALALAVSPLFWEWSLVFEAFSLNNLLAAAMIFLVLLWNEAPNRTSRLVGAALVGGLAFSNHQTIVLVAPAVLYLMWQHRAVLLARPYVLLACSGAFVAGLLPYASIPWAASRHPYMSWGAVSSLSDFLALVLRADYGTGQLVAASEFQGGSPGARLLALGSSLPPFQSALIVAGAIESYRRWRRYWWFTAIAFLVSGPAFVAYANMDLSKQGTLWVLQRFFLLPHVTVAPLMAFGALMLAGMASRLVEQRRDVVQGAVWVCALLIIGVSVATTYADVDQRHNQIAARYADDALDSLAPGTILLATGDEFTSPVAYAQAVEGKRPDVTLVMLPLTRGRWYLRHLRTRHSDLVVPTIQPGQLLTMKALVDANRRRPLAMMGRKIDATLEGSYGYIQHGLVSRVEPMTEQFDLGMVAAENDRLLKMYQAPAPSSIKEQTFEPTLLQAYAAPAGWVAKQYHDAGHPALARLWYERALAIDPSYADARNGLSEVAAK